MAEQDAAAKRRARQTIRNLILSLLACLGIVLVTVLAVPRDDSSRIKHIDYKAIAAEVSATSGFDVVAPELPAGWWSNKAEWKGSNADGVKTWYLGLIGPDNQYVGITQAFGVNPTWFVGQLGEGAAVLGGKPIGGEWFQYDANPQNDPPKTRDHVRALGISSIDKATGNALIMYGAESASDFEVVAKALDLTYAELQNQKGDK